MDKAMTFIIDLWHLVLKKVAKFGVVGGVAFIIDSGIYLALLHGPLSAKTITAKTISSVIATIFSYYANRHWTYTHQKTQSKTREMVLFFIFNGLAILISLFCLAVSHYILDYTSKTADFISSTIIGTILGMIFRYFTYDAFVFTGDKDEAKKEPKKAN
ncbi:MAG: GtrA family protein [Micrococcaceae bacterium]